MKKILAIFLAVMMALALVVTPALAAVVSATTVAFSDMSMTFHAASIFVDEITTLTSLATASGAGNGNFAAATAQASFTTVALTPSVITLPATASSYLSDTDAVNNGNNATEFTASSFVTGYAPGTTKVRTTVYGSPSSSFLNEDSDEIKVFAKPVLKYADGVAVGTADKITTNLVDVNTVKFTLTGTKGTGRVFDIAKETQTGNVDEAISTITQWTGGTQGASETISANTAAGNIVPTSTHDAEFTLQFPAGTEGLFVFSITADDASDAIGNAWTKSYAITFSKSAGVPYTDIKIKDKEKLSTFVGAGSEIAIAATGVPSSADEYVYWFSSNPTIAAFVNPDDTSKTSGFLSDCVIGYTPTVRALKAGKATITVQNLSGSLKDTYEITVGTKLAPTQIVLTNTNRTISDRNGKLTLTTKVYPEAAMQNVEWAIVQPASTSGWSFTGAASNILTSLGSASEIPGGVIILSAKTKDTDNPTVTAFFQINVAKYATPTSIEITKENSEIAVGNKMTLSASVKASAAASGLASNQSVEWFSSDKTVATIDSDGVLTALKAGTVTITAMSADPPNVTQTTTIKVVEELNTEIWTVISNTLKVRAFASSSANELGTLVRGTVVEYVSESGAWARIVYNDTEAYVARASIAKAPLFAVASGTLNVRDAKGSAGKVIAVANFADTLVILEDSNGWAKVIYNNKVCYMSSNYLKLAPLTGKITSNTLKVRAAAEGTSAVVGELTKADTVTLTGRTGAWYKITYGGTDAFVAASYIAIQ